jgi:polyphosphate glucokinase
MNVLVVDVGGTHVKVLVSGQKELRKFDSGPELVPKSMLRGVRKITEDWSYDVVSIGFPGPVLHNRPVAEPHNLGCGWLGFDFEAAFGHPVKMINDAAMQALGSYKGGKMLFLGLGTGLGSAMIVDGIIEPMELGHLPYKKHTYEEYVGERGLEEWGKRKWRRNVDYSKNRITDETLKLLLQLAEESGPARADRRHVRGRQDQHHRKSRGAARRAARAARGKIVVDGRNVVPEVHAVLDKMADSPSASAAASGRATPASAFATSSTSASAAPTSGR